MANLYHSPSIEIECSIILRDLIKEHHVLVRNVLKRHFKPKDHFMIHLPRVMEHCGPLVHLWCMRFEGKHHESKLLLSISCCKKNVCFTTAKKHQKKFASALYTKNLFPAHNMGPSRFDTFKELSTPFSKNLLQNTQFLNCRIELLSWVKKNGSLFKPNMIVCVKELHYVPVFRQIKFICLRRKNLLFIYRELKTVFCNHE